MTTSGWEYLTELYDRLEAEMVKSALEAEGIPAVLSQEAAGNLYPVTFGDLARIQVFVPQASLAEARDWLAKYEKGKPSPDEENGAQGEGEKPMQDTVILITREGMGHAPAALQLTLLGKYFELLLQGGDLPNAICFYTEAVKLVVEGSPLLESLHALEARGVRLIVCSTCLNFFGLQDKARAGIVGGMTDILEAQQKAGKVITL